MSANGFRMIRRKIFRCAISTQIYHTSLNFSAKYFVRVENVHEWNSNVFFVNRFGRRYDRTTTRVLWLVATIPRNDPLKNVAEPATSSWFMCFFHLFSLWSMRCGWRISSLFLLNQKIFRIFRARMTEWMSTKVGMVQLISKLFRVVRRIVDLSVSIRNKFIGYWQFIIIITFVAVRRRDSGLGNENGVEQRKEISSPITRTLIMP